MFAHRRHVLLAVCCLGAPAPAAAGERVDYLKEIKPLLREKCFACHGALKQQARLRLDTAALAKKGGRHGPAVRPGDVARSLLIERVTAADETDRMPPEGPPLSPAQVAKLKAWIAQGANAPGAEEPERDPREHWAFRAPRRPEIPKVRRAGWGANPIDAFLAAEHEKRGLSPRPPVAKGLLLRRVYLDLIGLPPTRAELRAFLADSSPGAYEKVVDRLLADPRYGERWGRHWMDVWRYSDWYGRRMVPDVWNSAPQIWRWRDWIVHSLNRDHGYDRMVREMLAADEICPGDEEAAVATGFLVRNWYALNPNDWMRSNVEHVGKAFLGLTFNCAHCHDHKYDPISHVDYFRFRAFFEPLGIRQDRARGEPDPGPFQEYSYSVLRRVQRLGTVQVFDKNPKAPTWFYTGGDERNRVKGKGPIAPGLPAVFGDAIREIRPIELPRGAHSPGTRPWFREARLAKLRSAVARAESERAEVTRAAAESLPPLRQALTRARIELAAAAVLARATGLPALRATADKALRAQRVVEAMELKARAAEVKVAAARASLASLRARIAADRAKYGEDKGADAAQRIAEASRAERDAAVKNAEGVLLEREAALAAAEAKPLSDPKRAKEIAAATTQVTAARAALGNARAASKAAPGTYTPLGPTYPQTSTGRRKALAEWITARDNPLTARVAVNHIWMRHFHAPLVSSVFDFGRNGAWPTHPELLDWLAVEFMESGWSMKRLHRLIVTSQAYRMASSRGAASDNAARDPENRFLWRGNVGRMEAEAVRDSLLYLAGLLEPRMGGQELENHQALTTRRRSLYYSCNPEGDGKSEFGALFDAPDAGECYRRTRTVVPQQALALTNSNLVHQVSAKLAQALWAGLSGAEREAPAAFITAAYETVLARGPSAAELAVCIEFLRSGTGPQARASLVLALLNHNDFITIR